MSLDQFFGVYPTAFHALAAICSPMLGAFTLGLLLGYFSARDERKFFAAVVMAIGAMLVIVWVVAVDFKVGISTEQAQNSMAICYVGLNLAALAYGILASNKNRNMRKLNSFINRVIGNSNRPTSTA